MNRGPDLLRLRLLGSNVDATGSIFLYHLLHALPSLPSHCLGHMEGNPKRQVDADEPPGILGDGQCDHSLGVSGRAVSGVLMKPVAAKLEA